MPSLAGAEAVEGGARGLLGQLFPVEGEIAAPERPPVVPVVAAQCPDRAHPGSLAPSAVGGRDRAPVSPFSRASSLCFAGELAPAGTAGPAIVGFVVFVSACLVVGPGAGGGVSYAFALSCGRGAEPGGIHTGAGGCVQRADPEVGSRQVLRRRGVAAGRGRRAAHRIRSGLEPPVQARARLRLLVSPPHAGHLVCLAVQFDHGGVRRQADRGEVDRRHGRHRSGGISHLAARPNRPRHGLLDHLHKRDDRVLPLRGRPAADADHSAVGRPGAAAGFTRVRLDSGPEAISGCAAAGRDDRARRTSRGPRPAGPGSRGG